MKQNETLLEDFLKYNHDYIPQHETFNDEYKLNQSFAQKKTSEISFILDWQKSIASVECLQIFFS